MRRTRNQVRATSDDTRRRRVSLRPASPRNNASFAEASPPAFRAACTPAPTTYRKPIARTRSGYESPVQRPTASPASVRIARASSGSRDSRDSPIFVPLSRADRPIPGIWGKGEVTRHLPLSLARAPCLLFVATRETRQRASAPARASSPMRIRRSPRAGRVACDTPSAWRQPLRAHTCRHAGARFMPLRSVRRPRLSPIPLGSMTADRYLGSSRFTRVAPTTSDGRAASESGGNRGWPKLDRPKASYHRSSLEENNGGGGSGPGPKSDDTL